MVEPLLLLGGVWNEYLPVLAQSEFCCCFLSLKVAWLMKGFLFMCRMLPPLWYCKVRRFYYSSEWDCLSSDEKLAFVFAVSTLAPEKYDDSPSAERFTFPLDLAWTQKSETSVGPPNWCAERKAGVGAVRDHWSDLPLDVWARGRTHSNLFYHLYWRSVVCRTIT